MTDARALHADAVVVDTHDDLLMLTSRRPRSQQAAYFRESWLPQLRAGGVDVQVLPVFVDDAYRPEGALRQTLRMLESGWTIAEGNPDDVAVCLTGADVDAVVSSGRIALVLALEGLEAVGTDVELLSTLHRVGVRVASLTHFGRTALADGSGEDPAGSRLTRAGVEAVGLMEDLGMLVDVSHLGALGVDHVLEVARRPVVATHSSAFELRGHHRNLTDARLTGIAAGGGVVNVNLFAGFLDEDPARFTVGRVADHLEHVAEVAGVGAVGLGPDFLQQVFDELHPGVDSLVMEGVDAKWVVPGLEGPAGLPLVTEELVRRGWADDDVRAVLGGNDQRLFRAELGVPLSSR
ncbi:MAG: Membrane dipeptidase [Frankiales bacterium]|nr:Membrane dipeptidase [Frankiales bacterium]